MEIMSTTPVYHSKEMDLSGGNSSFWEVNEENEKNNYTFPTSLKIGSLVIFSLVSVLGMSGNAVVIWVTGFKMKKTVNTVWYLNLAVADFLATAFLLLRITNIALDLHWPFGTFMCKMDGMVFYMNMYASIYTLVVISVDRCVSVVCPVWAQNHRDVRKASWVSLGVWVLALALSSPFLIFKETKSSGHDKVRCYLNLYSKYITAEVRKFRFGALLIPSFIMTFVVPFTVIVSCYSVIIYRLRNNRSLASQSGRPFKIIATVITAYFLCWAPFNIVILITLVNVLATEFSKTLDDMVKVGIPATFSLAVLNNCLNPLLYVFMGHDFKDVFRRSILKLMEKAFAEDLPQTNTSSNPESSIHDTQDCISHVAGGPLALRGP